MAELAVTDGRPPPDDLPRGDCILTSLHDDEGNVAGVRIDHADSRILISAPLLYEIADGCSPWAYISAPPPMMPIPPDPMPNWHGRGAMEGAVLTIRAVNRTVIYRIGEYVPCVHGYIAEWPD